MTAPGSSKWQLRDEVMASLPPVWPEELLPAIRRRLVEGNEKVVVIDDDPTGTQTVHGIPVLTEWSGNALEREFVTPGPAFFLLTNSRAMPLAKAAELNWALGRALRAAIERTGRSAIVVSRGDSTLRGHFPGEVDALADGLYGPMGGCDGVVLVPFFEEGGRYTIDDVHYVSDSERLVPAGETEFARDPAFGYRSSNLRDWVAEKTRGRIPAETVLSISLDTLRNKGPQGAAEVLEAARDGQIVVANAASRRDLEVLVMAMLEAEASGRRYLVRAAASFAAVRAGIAPRPCLSAAELRLRPGAGLTVAGSYVPKTTEQIEAVRDVQLAEPIELSVERVLQSSKREDEIELVAAHASRCLAARRDALVYTSREVNCAGTPVKSLEVGASVSAAVVDVVRRIEGEPRYLIAKGGVTSSDIATGALGVRRATVLGQLVPGVPVWELGPESGFPGVPYVVFPGNVGGPGALADAIRALRAPV